MFCLCFFVAMRGQRWLRSYNGDLVPHQSEQTKTAVGQSSVMFVFQGTTEFELLASAQYKEIPLKMEVVNPVQVAVSNAKGKVVYEQKFEPSGNMEDINILLPEPGLYNLKITGGRIKVQIPSGVPLVLRVFRTIGGRPTPRLYVLCPG